MIQLLDIPRKHHCSLSNVKLILVINNSFLEFNEVLNGLNNPQDIRAESWQIKKPLIYSETAIMVELTNDGTAT